MGRLMRWIRRLKGASRREVAGGPRGTAAGAGAALLRHDIDSGRTGDKVAAPDPAAAPLGTDDEAAGHTPTAEEVDRARRQERKR